MCTPWDRLDPRVKRIAYLVCVLMLAPGVALAKESEWSSLKVPVAGKAESIGFYTNGCVIGAATLSAKGQGFESIRRHRNRYYGHPDLVTFVKGYARAIDDENLGPILVGDMSQPGGGPMAFGHRSHQLGLDVDLWFTRPQPKYRSKDEGFPSMVDAKKEAVNPSVWSGRQRRYIELAAKHPDVSRVLVNWVIKRALCAEVKEDREWLRKVRPWWGHDRHFHVRLKCPEGNRNCMNQRPTPSKDDCGRERWFSDASVKARQKAEKGKTKPKPKPKKKKPIHPRCQKLLQQ